MTAPTLEPIDNRILTAIAAKLAGISTANNYYNDVAGAGIEPLAFDDGDQYPQIVVREESSVFSDTKGNGFEDTKVVAMSGFFPFTPGTAAQMGFRLREDITVCAAKLAKADFLNADGSPLINTIALTGAREIKNSDENADFVEVVVRVQVTHRRFFPRPAGGL